MLFSFLHDGFHNGLDLDDSGVFRTKSLLEDVKRFVVVLQGLLTVAHPIVYFANVVVIHCDVGMLFA